MSTTVISSGRPQRKQLSDHLNRLDGIIDCLADALPAAVADACREGARQAVKDALVEILANPEIRSLIHGMAAARVAPPSVTVPPQKPAKPSLWARIKSRLQSARDAVFSRSQCVVKSVTCTALTLTALMPIKKILLVGAVIGLTMGVVSYYSPPVISAIVGGIGAACTVVAAQMGWFLRRTVALLGFGTC